MKVKFSLVRTYVPEWDGNRDLDPKDQISCAVSTMGNADLMELADAMERSGFKDGEVDTTDVPVNVTKILLEEVGRLLPKYIVLTGLEGDDGPLDIATIVQYPMFNPLCMEILMELANLSQPDQDDLKN